MFGVERRVYIEGLEARFERVPLLWASYRGSCVIWQSPLSIPFEFGTTQSLAGYRDLSFPLNLPKPSEKRQVNINVMSEAIWQQSNAQPSNQATPLKLKRIAGVGGIGSGASTRTDKDSKVACHLELEIVDIETGRVLHISTSAYKRATAWSLVRDMYYIFMIFSTH